MLTTARDTVAGSPEMVLSAREAEVLSLILQGLGNKEIAARLGLAVVSVKQYASALLRKFDVPNRAALTHAGVRMALAGSVGLEASWLPQLLRDAHMLIAVMAGPQLRFVAVSETVTRLVGGRALIGRALREALPEYEAAGLFEPVERVFATGEPMVEHARVVPTVTGISEGVGYRDFILQALRDDQGAINGVVYFGINVTEQVAAARRA